MYTSREYNTDLIKGMNAIMISMNNENAYLEWINTVPDEPTEDDFEFIAETPDLFQATIHEFVRITRKYLSDGLYICTDIGDTYINKLFTGKRRNENAEE